MLSFCYHFVIIVIDNIFYDGCTGWCLFLSFFWRQKMTFSHPLFCVTIMLLFFLLLLHKLILLYFDSICTRVEKILRKWTRIDVQKWDRRKTFGKIRRALGVLRNFFGTNVVTPYMLSQFLKIKTGQKILATKMHICASKCLNWAGWCADFGQTCFPEKGFAEFGTSGRGAFF